MIFYSLILMIIIAFVVWDLYEKVGTLEKKIEKLNNIYNKN